jgi:hypothetical protein
MKECWDGGRLTVLRRELGRRNAALALRHRARGLLDGLRVGSLALLALAARPVRNEAKYIRESIVHL